MEAFTELQKANMTAEFAVGLAMKEMKQGPSVLSERRRQEARSRSFGGNGTSKVMTGKSQRSRNGVAAEAHLCGCPFGSPRISGGFDNFRVPGHSRKDNS